MITLQANLSYLTTTEVASVTIWNHGIKIYEIESFKEHLLMRHTQYRHEQHLVDDINESDSECYVINWGIYSSKGLSNHMVMKDESLYVQFTCTPAVTGTYHMNIMHDYYQFVSYDKEGTASVVS